MSLSDQDKQRIREEEAYRLQVRDDLRRESAGADRWKPIVFWIVLAAVAVLLFAVLRSNRP